MCNKKNSEKSGEKDSQLFSFFKKTKQVHLIFSTINKQINNQLTNQQFEFDMTTKKNDIHEIHYESNKLTGSCATIFRQINI